MELKTKEASDSGAGTPGSPPTKIYKNKHTKRPPESQVSSLNQVCKEFGFSGTAEKQQREMTPAAQLSFDNADMGFRMIALAQDTKEPCEKKWPVVATTDKAILLEKFGRGGQFEHCQLGICPGEDFFVVDVDIKDGQPGIASLAELKAKGIPETRTHRTPSGGKHLFFRKPYAAFVISRTAWLPGIDLKGDKGQVVAPGSTFNKKTYEVIDDREMAVYPNHLFKDIPQKAYKTSKNTASRVIPLKKYKTSAAIQSLISSAPGSRFETMPEVVPAGQRDSTTNGFIWHWKGKLYPKEETLVLVKELYGRCDQPKGNEFTFDVVKDQLDRAYADHEESCSSDEIKVDQQIAEMNKRFAAALIGNKFAILYEKSDPVSGGVLTTFISPTDFKYLHSNKCVPGTTQNIGNYWLKHPQRREYESVGFFPGDDAPDNYYNFFRGFGVKSAEGSWYLMHKHIRDIICSGNIEHFNYLMTWIADLFQNPGGARPGVAIVLMGGQGFGKGELARQLGKMIGAYFKHITQQKHLTGHFNSLLKDALLVFLDEGFWGGDKAATGVLKGLITEDTLCIEHKGVDAFFVKNFIRLIIASNSPWVIPAGVDERRFLALRVSEDKKQDHKYFQKLRDEMDNGGREAMLFDLLRMDISGVNLRKAPRTETLFDQIIRSEDSVFKFWYDILSNGKLHAYSPGWFELDAYSREWDKVLVQDFYDRYCAYAKNLGDHYPMPDSLFGKRLRELCPDIKKCRPGKDGSRAWEYKFPSLDECRKTFESIVNFEIDWSADTETDEGEMDQAKRLEIRPGKV